MATNFELSQKTRLKSIWQNGTFTLAHLANDVYPNLYAALLPVLMIELSFNTAQATFIATVVSLTTQLLQPLTGTLSDRIGGRMFVVGGLVVGAVFVSGSLAYASSYLLLLGGLLFGGLGNALFHPHMTAIVGEMTSRHKGLGMGLFMVGGHIGRALAPILATSAYLIWERKGIISISLLGIIAALVIFGTLSPTIVSLNIKKAKEKLPILLVLKRGSLLIGIQGFRFMTNLSVLTMIPILWASRGGKIEESAVILSFLFIAASLGNVIGGALSDRFGAKPILIGSAIFTSILIISFVNTTNLAMSLLLIFILGFFLYSTGSVVVVLSQMIFPENKGMASGLTTGFGNTLGSLGVPMIGLIANNSTPEIGLYSTALSILGIIPLTLMLKTPKN